MRLTQLALAGLLMVPLVAHAGTKLPKDVREVDQASALIVKGQFAAAEPLLHKAIRVTANDPWAHFNLAVVYRNTGRYDEAVREYHMAKDLFQTRGPRPNGEADIGNALYGIALAQEAKGEPRVAAAAWEDYLRFARKYNAEQPAVQIAQMRLDGQMRAANMKGPYPFGPPTATRPGAVR